MRRLLHAAVPFDAEAQEHVVLQQHLGARTGEVQGEGGHFAAKITDLEHQAFWQVGGGAPYDPAEAGVDQAVFMA